jgi:hypothetical protein
MKKLVEQKSETTNLQMLLQLDTISSQKCKANSKIVVFNSKAKASYLKLIRVLWQLL